MKIDQHFAQRCVEGQMDTWEPRKDRGHPVLTVGNRYLSLTKDEGTKQQLVPMKDVIDPLGILQDAAPSAVHTTENQVLYFERALKGNT